ncbi:hypothetical protein NM208_g12481 [Fusarium decemcellulare]|uniref:Uncharacterized protein n=1 Tax=Fusarium decemcellulare TaxID=57161 RepID=A0ACC1RS12_9HYPO|nr:hypothetical protein NM208_g12481 [Fusarium decemcellulare]
MSPIVSLPNARVLAKQFKLDIVATPSLCLDLPNHLSPVSTIDELLALVKDANVWIARTGPCYIEVSVAVHGHPVLENDRLKDIVELIQHCQVWARLGLRLEYNRDSIAQLPGLLSFSIQHLDLTSALTAPAAAHTAPFRALLLSIDISSPNEKRDSSEQDSTRRKKRRRNVGKRNGNGDTDAVEDNDLPATLGLDDQRAIDSFISSLNFPTNGNSRKRSLERRAKDDEALWATVLKGLCSSSSVEILIEHLMVGSGKKYSGYQVWSGSSTYCLTRLIPGVFHLSYIQTISGYAQLLPVIATSLARMRNAESPVLREKVARLRLGNPIRRPADPSSGLEGIVQDKRRTKKSAPSVQGSRDSGPGTAGGRQASTRPERSVGNPHTRINNLLNDEEAVEEMNLKSASFQPEQWAEPVNSLSFSTIPRGQESGASWVGNGLSMAYNEALLIEDDDPMSPMNQASQDMGYIMNEDASYDPGNFGSLDQWLSCGQGI